MIEGESNGSRETFKNGAAAEAEGRPRSTVMHGDACTATPIVQAVQVEHFELQITVGLRR
jgi:hypothetical protein